MNGPASAPGRRGPPRVSAMLVGVCAQDLVVPSFLGVSPGARAQQTSLGYGCRSGGLRADDLPVPMRAGPDRVSAAPDVVSSGSPS